MNDTTDAAMRDGMRELARQRDPVLSTIASAAGVALEVCSCTVISGTWQQGHRQTWTRCHKHETEYQEARGKFRLWPTYEQGFAKEADARDYQKILTGSHPGPGYSVSTGVYQIGQRWLLLAHWYSTE